MTKAFSRRAFLLTAAAAAAGAPAFAKPPSRSLLPHLRPAGLNKRAADTAVEVIARARISGKAGYALADAETGKMLESFNPDLALPPASVAKTLTAAYGLGTLGAGYRFATKVIATGGIKGGIVQGDLVLAGGGDPTLDTDGLAELAKRAKAAGITEVRGRFLVWGGALPFAPMIDTDQPEQVGYNPAVSGLNLNYNRVHFEWRKAGGDWSVSMDARSDHYRPDVRIARMQIVARDLPIYTYEDAGGRDNWTVARGALGGGGARWLPVRKPELYAGEVFQTFMGAHGIRLKAPELSRARPVGEDVARLDSAPLDALLREMLKFSTNLTAEAVGLAATSARTGLPASLATSARAMSEWAHGSLGLGSAALVDHSGLGDASRICARDMVRALIAWRSGLAPLLKPISLREKMTASVQAKTGTLNFVSGLAGFVTPPGGRQLAFAIFAADLPRRDALSRAERERPQGAKGWNTQAKALQLDLIERWSVIYGA